MKNQIVLKAKQLSENILALFLELREKIKILDFWIVRTLSNGKTNKIFEIYGKNIFKLTCHTQFKDPYEQNKKHHWQ